MLLVVAVNDHRLRLGRGRGPRPNWEAATGLSGSQIDSILSSNWTNASRLGDYAGGIVDFAKRPGHQIETQPGNPAAKPTEAPPPHPAARPRSTRRPPRRFCGRLSRTHTPCGAGPLLVFCAFRSLVGRGRLNRGEHRNQQNRRAWRQAKQAPGRYGRRHTQQELGFAQAEFTDADCAPFAARPGTRPERARPGFKLRQQLDDSTPDDPPTRVRC